MPKNFRISQYLVALLFAAVFPAQATSPHLPIPPRHAPPLKQDISFYTNSVRRDLFDFERQMIVQTKGDESYCTGFWVKNQQNRDFLMSQRHCFDFKATDYCKSGNIGIYWADAPLGQCKQVLIDDEKFDIVLLEIDMIVLKWPKNPLTLAAIPPEANSRLKAIGLPEDKYRYGKATASENCWTLTSIIGRKAAYLGASKKVQVALAPTKALSILYNCNLWGGNSGGPILLEDSDIVLGIPMSSRHDYQLFAGQLTEKASDFIPMSAFVEEHKTQLSQLGIAMTDHLPSSSLEKLRQGSFAYLQQFQVGEDYLSRNWTCLYRIKDIDANAGTIDMELIAKDRLQNIACDNVGKTNRYTCDPYPSQQCKTSFHHDVYYIELSSKDFITSHRYQEGPQSYDSFTTLVRVGSGMESL